MMTWGSEASGEGMMGRWGAQSTSEERHGAVAGTGKGSIGSSISCKSIGSRFEDAPVGTLNVPAWDGCRAMANPRALGHCKVRQGGIAVESERTDDIAGALAGWLLASDGWPLGPGPVCYTGECWRPGITRRGTADLISTRPWGPVPCQHETALRSCLWLGEADN
ncbi:hypothetical protein LZ32DRAFT_400053 [Colletotrichum eremochloae]|nr:hypothetical protein LZ32DRAFT_400053 [Colletotrichum eremochloae]